MLILLSPTKKQKPSTYDLETPLLFDDLKDTLLTTIQSYNQEEIKKRYKISDKLTLETHHRFQNYSEEHTALFTYSGEAFASLNPSTLSKEDILYANEHLRIFSALYGLLEPLNKISLYRLDMLTKIDINLHTYWSKTLTKYLNELNRPIINLASQEFSSMIDVEKLKVPITHIVFYNKDESGNLKVVSAHAKKARGAFARALITNKTNDLKSIEVNGYKFSHAKDNLLIYIK